MKLRHMPSALEAAERRCQSADAMLAAVLAEASRVLETGSAVSGGTSLAMRVIEICKGAPHE